MKINKIIYWTSPLLAWAIYISMGIISDLIGKNEPQEPYPGPSFPEEAIIFFNRITGVIVVMLGYIVTFLYQKLRYRKIVLLPILLLFLAWNIIPATKSCFVYDFTKNGAILTFIIGFLQGILIYSSHSLFLIILLYWSSKKERQKIKQTQQQTR